MSILDPNSPNEQVGQNILSNLGSFQEILEPLKQDLTLKKVYVSKKVNDYGAIVRSQEKAKYKKALQAIYANFETYFQENGIEIPSKDLFKIVFLNTHALSGTFIAKGMKKEREGAQQQRQQQWQHQQQSCFFYFDEFPMEPDGFFDDVDLSWDQTGGAPDGGDGHGEVIDGAGGDVITTVGDIVQDTPVDTGTEEDGTDTVGHDEAPVAEVPANTGAAKQDRTEDGDDSSVAEFVYTPGTAHLRIANERKALIRYK